MENLEPPDLGFASMEPIQGFSSDLDCHQSEPPSQHSSIIMPSFLNNHRAAGLSISDSSEFGLNDSLDLHDFAITAGGTGLGNHVGMSTLHSELSMFSLPGGPSMGFPPCPPPPPPGHGDLTMPQSVSITSGTRMPVYSFLPRSSFMSSEPCASVSLPTHPHPSFSFHSFPVPGGFGDGFPMPVTCPPGLSFRGLPNIETMVIGSDPSRSTGSSLSGHLSDCPPPQVVPISSFLPPVPKYIPPSPVPISSPNLAPKTPNATVHKNDQAEAVCAEMREAKAENVSLSSSSCSNSVAGGPVASSDRSVGFSTNAQLSPGIAVLRGTSQTAVPISSVQMVIGHAVGTNYQSDLPSNERLPVVSSVNSEIENRINQENEKVELNSRLNSTAFSMTRAEPPQHVVGENSGSVLQSGEVDEKTKSDRKSKEFLAVECESVTNSDCEELSSSLARNPISSRDIKGEPCLSDTILSNLKMEDRLQLESAGFLGYDLGDADLSSATAGFAEKVDISIHVEESQCVIVDGHKRWKCLQCPKMYSTKHNLITHILGHRGIKPHYCSICGKFFKQISHLQTHLLTHGKVKPHACTVCNRNFTQTSHVKRHMAIHMERRPHVCEHCNRGFAYPNELKNHLDKHKTNTEHTCEECGTTFDVIEKLRRHKSVEHRDAAALVCKVCGKVYTYPSQLRDHVMKHEGTRPYICGECGMDFMKEHHLKAHVFTHTGLKPYACRLCDKAFNQKANLQRHMLVHNGEKKYACEMCGRGFTQHQVLRAHLVTHQDTKPYQCKVCGKGFSRLHNLNGHMHMHDGEKPFICYCGASFTLKGNLNRHRKDKQCQPVEGRESNSPSKEEEAAKILNEMSSRKSKAESEAEGSPTPKKKRKSVPRKTMSQDAVNDVDEEVAAAWQLVKDGILEEEDNDDDEEEDEEEEDEEGEGEETDQKPNYAELMAMFPEHGAEIEDEAMTTASSNAQSMFQCLDSNDPAFQFPVDSRAVEVITFLNPYSSSGHDQTSLKYQPNAADTNSMSVDLISKFPTHDTISVTKHKANPNGTEMAPSQKKRRVALPEKALGSDASRVCAVPAADSTEVESLINSTFNRMLANKPDGLRQNEGIYKTVEDLEDRPSGDPREKNISDLNADDDRYLVDNGQMSSDHSVSRSKAARLGKKASQAALFGEKLVSEHKQT